MLGSLAAIAGCAADLLPGELVVPGEVPAVAFHGSAGTNLGAAVALDGEHLLAGAPGGGDVWRLDEGATSGGPRGLGRAVWWAEGVPWAARLSDAVYRVDGVEAEESWTIQDMRFVAAGVLGGEVRVASSRGTWISLWDMEGRLLDSVACSGVQRLAIGAERVLVLICTDEDCQAWAWPVGTQDLEPLGLAGRGGAIVEHDGQAWWGLPALDDADAAGEVCAEDGTCIAGIAGDHLGRYLCAGYAAGLPNFVTVPGRLRLVPLDGGPVLALDRALPDYALSLDCNGERIAVGMPAAGLHTPGEGEVLLIERP
jgi:hypothetical protein